MKMIPARGNKGPIKRVACRPEQAIASTAPELQSLSPLCRFDNRLARPRFGLREQSGLGMIILVFASCALDIYPRIPKIGRGEARSLETLGKWKCTDAKANCRLWLPRFPAQPGCGRRVGTRSMY